MLWNTYSFVALVKKEALHIINHCFSGSACIDVKGATNDPKRNRVYGSCKTRSSLSQATTPKKMGDRQLYKFSVPEKVASSGCSQEWQIRIDYSAGNINLFVDYVFSDDFQIETWIYDPFLADITSVMQTLPKITSLSPGQGNDAIWQDLNSVLENSGVSWHNPALTWQSDMWELCLILLLHSSWLRVVGTCHPQKEKSKINVMYS